jgi:nucleoside 2-deoxyribosyltransferase
MAICFVIQPFDAGRFDKRFEDVYAPAIELAGLTPYRVDRDPTVEVPIESIEEGIRKAAVCLADITTDNPNVWYELGFAFAAGRPVLMICSDERASLRYPFDIQHRTILSYGTDSPKDFEKFKAELIGRLEALLKKGETLRQIAESEQVASNHGLSQPELAVLAVLAGETSLPGSICSMWSLKNDVERAGYTAIGFSLGFRRLIAKRLIISVEHTDERGDQYEGAKLTEIGWKWIEANEHLFSIRREKELSLEWDKEVPF